MKEFIKKHATKKRLVSLGLVAVAATGVAGYRDFTQTKQPLRYVMSAVTKGTLVTTVTGSGQVSGLNQIDLKPSVSGEITKVLAKQGDQVKEGTVLFQIDNQDAVKAMKDAQQSVTDANLSLQSAQISLQKLKEPPDAVSLLQAQNALNQAKRDLQTLKDGAGAIDIQQAQNDLNLQLQNVQMASDGVTPKVVRDAYDNAANTLKSVVQTLLQDLTDADSVLGIDSAFSQVRSVINVKVYQDAAFDYPYVKSLVADSKTAVNGLPLTNGNMDDIDAALQKTQSALEAMDQFLRKVLDVIEYSVTSVSFSQSSLDSLRNTIQSDLSGVTTKYTSVTGQTNAIDDAKMSYQTSLVNVQKAQDTLDKLKEGASVDDLATAEEKVLSAQAALDKLQKGAEALDIATAENSIASRRAAYANAASKLADARSALGDYNVEAPFDGIVAKVSVNRGDQASASTALATLVTNDMIAEISLNEVDVTKVRVGQKASLAFDAITDLSIAGTVSEVDTIGTVSQGVVNYSVKVVFSTQDDRIKPGMSASVSIATNVVTDALLAPNAAVHTQNGASYVQTLQNVDVNAATSNQGVTSVTGPEDVSVEIGLANDQSTVITSGLNEGDLVIVRTIDPNTTTAASAATSNGTRSAATGGVNAIRIGGGFSGGFVGR